MTMTMLIVIGSPYASPDWRTVIYLTIDYPPPPDQPLYERRRECAPVFVSIYRPCQRCLVMVQNRTFLNTTPSQQRQERHYRHYQ
jgi:hypothetical protein